MTKKNKALRYDIHQKHLGFCPAELVLEVCVWGLALEFDGSFIEKHTYFDLIMWSASKDKVTIMISKNMKRIVLKTHGSKQAKKIVMEMMKGAERLRRKLEPRLEHALSVDEEKEELTEEEKKDEKNKAKLKKHMPNVSMMSTDSEDFGPNFLTFQGLKQTHIPDKSEMCLLKVDEVGVALLDRLTGKPMDEMLWSDILLWQTDSEPPAITFIMTETNFHIRLETTLAADIMEGMTEFARKLLKDRSKPVIPEKKEKATLGDISPGAEDDDEVDGEGGHFIEEDRQTARDLVIEYRRKMLSYVPQIKDVHDGWKAKVTKTARLKAILTGGGMNDLSKSIETREQLQAIFASVDKDHSGTLESSELAVLLEDLSMKPDPDELETIMREMDTNFDGEIEFEEFVTWVSSQGSAESTANLRQRIKHRQKEIGHLQEMFDRIDVDCNGTMDLDEFQQLTVDVGLALNAIELQSLWLELDEDSSGEVEFDEFVKWFKGQNKGIAAEMRRSMRMSKMLACAKGAMIYAVDQGNRSGKKKLKEMFDYLDTDGSGELGKEEIVQLATDLKIKVSDREIDDALEQMDEDGNGEIGFDEFRSWWCSTGGGGGGLLRAKLKLAGFTAKASGSVIHVTQTSDDGAIEAERQLDELLTSAFAKPQEMTGRSLGVFGPTNPMRVWCYKTVFNPVADRALLFIIFLNLFLSAMQSPGSEKSETIAFINFFIVIIFTAEMGMRIMSHGLWKGDKAYMQDGWNLLDGIIIGVVWGLYIVTIVFTIDETISYLVTLLRSFRALRFFANMRQILLAIVQGRAMLGAVTVFVLFMFMLYYVILHQLFTGAFTVVCAKASECTVCGVAIKQCPAAFLCDSTVIDGVEPYSCFFRNDTAITDSYDRLQHVGKFGFDSIGQSFLTTFGITTLDEWSFLSNALMKSNLSTAGLAWPTIASLVVTISLFTLNIFVSSLAFSYIKVRKTARNLDSKDQIEKNVVDNALNEGLAEQIKFQRHVLQAWHPAWTRKTRWLMRQSAFEYSIIFVVLANISCLMLVQHNMSPQLKYVLDVLELVYTCIYTAEMCIKIQAMGVQLYVQVPLNLVDGAIVLAALAGYVMLILSVEVDTRRAAILRVFRLLRLVRVARVAKLVFRSENIRQMISKSFGGLDAIGSLVMFMLFFMSVCSIAAMSLFYHCDDGTSTAHKANFRTFFESFLTTFQVFTADSWGSIMAETMECAGSVASIYFIVVIFIGNFVLGNMFIAIFIENLEISDEEKRDKQVEAYIASINTAGDEPGGGVAGTVAALGAVKHTLDKADESSALKHYTFDALMKGAKLTPKLASGLFRKEGGDQGGVMSKLFGQNKASSMGSGIDMRMYANLSDASLGFFYPNNPVRVCLQGFVGSALYRYLMLLFVALSCVCTSLAVDVENGNPSDNMRYFVNGLQSVLFVVFFLEMAAKVIADGFFSTPRAYWRSLTNRFEFFLVGLQFWCLLYPQFTVFLCFRVCRSLYMIKRISVMVEAFTSSMVAVWTVLVLMLVTLVVYGIAGVFLFAGTFWHCEGDLALGRVACEAAGFRWANRPFHFDNIVEAWSSLFIIWSMQGWTYIWFWAMDAAEFVDEAPSHNNSSLTASIYCISFILWNSFLLTKLFTAMLADFFAQSSGSVLMTTEQRNWQFMSMFIYSALKDDTRTPPKHPLRKLCFMIISARWFHIALSCVIVVNVSSMVGESSTVTNDPTGVLVILTQQVNELTLAIYTMEAFLRIFALGWKAYWNERKLDLFVLLAMGAAAGYPHYVHRLEHLENFNARADWILAFQFVRALRLASVFAEVYAIRKIYFILGMSASEVVNLLAFMAVVFFVFGVWFQSICGGIPHGVHITDTNNFDSVMSSVMYLFEICTGSSLLGVVDECRQYNGPLTPLYFYLFFFLSNLVLLNLFVALLLDNFDLMGSDDFAVSDVDIHLYKSHWQAYGYGLHEKMNIATLKHFLVHQTKALGTFGMMPQADPHFFNRVLFELDLTREDELEAEKEVAFFPLLLALCHMRFSSSCLSLGEEVEKSEMIMARVETHAARLIQIAWNFHVAKRNPDPEYQGIEGRPQWDAAVQVAWLLQTASTIAIDRITPEHVVADALDKLQVLVDRKESQKYAKEQEKHKSFDSEDGLGSGGGGFGGFGKSIDRTNSQMFSSFDSDDSLSDDQIGKHRKKGIHKKDKKLKDIKQFTKNPMMAKSIIGMSGDYGNFDPMAVKETPTVGVRNLNPMMLGSFDSEDFFDNSVEVVEKVTVKKSRKGRAKKSRLANLKDQDSEVVKKVNPITAVGTAISTDGSNGTDESKNGSSKTGSSKNGSKKGKGKKKRRGSLTSFFAADGGVSDGDASPGNNIKIDNPILTVKSSDDGENGSLVMKNPLDMMDSMDDPELDPFAVMKSNQKLGMQNPLNALDDVIQKKNPLLISQPSFDPKSLSAAMSAGQQPNNKAVPGQSREDVMKTLAWKERNAFSTRKAG